MSYACICRVIKDKEADAALETLDPTRKVDHYDVSQHCGGDKNFDNPGGYNCGRCSESFQQRAEFHNARLEERRKALSGVPCAETHEQAKPDTFEPA